MLVTKPPITTVARGRCTSAPVPWEIATGTKPMLAASAVMRNGRSRRRAPCNAASSGVANPSPGAGQIAVPLATTSVVVVPGALVVGDDVVDGALVVDGG